MVEVANSSLKNIKKSKIFCTDQDNEVITKYLCDGFIKLPKLETKNLNAIFQKLKKKQIHFVLPTKFRASFWSKNKNYFKKKSIEVIVSNTRSINLCLDKYAFYLF